jgi:hypothetical protein
METMSGLDGLGWPNTEDEPKPKTMSDTPETDAEVNEMKSATTYNMVWAEFARKLERERDEAREETIRTREFMGRGFARAKEELATMETRHAATMMHTQSVVEDANQLREQRDAVTLRLGNTQERMIDAERQRDRLAEAVNAATVLIAAKGRHNTMLAYEGLRSALSPENA